MHCIEIWLKKICLQKICHMINSIHTVMHFDPVTRDRDPDLSLVQYRYTSVRMSDVRMCVTTLLFTR